MSVNTLADIKGDVRANLQANLSELADHHLVSYINQAIQMGEAKHLYIPVIDETLVVVATTYEYPLTGGTHLGTIKYIDHIYQLGDEAGVYDDYIPRNYYSVEVSTTPYLFFYPSLAASKLIDAKTLRVVGYKPQARVSDDDTDTIDLPPMFVVWKATAIGHAALASAINRRGEWHRTQISYAEQQAEDARVGAKDYRIPSGAKAVKGR